MAVKVVASKREHDLITTNSDDLRRIAKEEMEKKARAAEAGQEQVQTQADELTPGELLYASRRQQKLLPVSRKKVRL